ALGGALVIALGLGAWSAFDVGFAASPPSHRIALGAWLSSIVTNLMGLLAIVFATRVADRRVAQGAGRLATYASALLAGSAAAAFAQLGAHQWLHLREWQVSTNSTAGIAMVIQPLVAFSEYLVWGSLFIFIHVNRRSALLSAERLKAAQMRRVEARSRTLEWRFQALQARVEPQFLFRSLGRVRDLYESDPAQGHAALGKLIAYLRRALPQLREAASTLRQEVDLAIAYLDVIREGSGENLALEIEVPDAVGRARMPTMVLLPLVNHLLPQGPASTAIPGKIHIGAATGAGRLRLEITWRGEDDEAGQSANRDGNDLHEVEERLAALYGDACQLTVRTSADDGLRMILEIPHEPADGSHR
ncbi:MAG TPA: histidine kinase, partial [Casimicrobiaceae bacterium]|nr:histidine kinase [Casimicrobiaceae bacterium]